MAKVKVSFIRELDVETVEEAEEMIDELFLQWITEDGEVASAFDYEVVEE